MKINGALFGTGKKLSSIRTVLPKRADLEKLNGRGLTKHEVRLKLKELTSQSQYL